MEARHGNPGINEAKKNTLCGSIFWSSADDAAGAIEGLADTLEDPRPSDIERAYGWAEQSKENRWANTILDQIIPGWLRGIASIVADEGGDYYDEEEAVSLASSYSYIETMFTDPKDVTELYTELVDNGAYDEMEADFGGEKKVKDFLKEIQKGFNNYCKVAFHKAWA